MEFLSSEAYDFFVYQDIKIPYSLTQVLKVKNNTICAKYLLMTKLGTGPLIWELEGYHWKPFYFSQANTLLRKKKMELMLKRLEKKECPLDSVTLCEDSFLLELKSNKRGYKEISRKIDQNPWFLGIQWPRNPKLKNCYKPEASKVTNIAPSSYRCWGNICVIIS